jgi:hypothetical protein
MQFTFEDKQELLARYVTGVEEQVADRELLLQNGPAPEVANRLRQLNLDAKELLRELARTPLTRGPRPDRGVPYAIIVSRKLGSDQTFIHFLLPTLVRVEGHALLRERSVKFGSAAPGNGFFNVEVGANYGEKGYYHERPDQYKEARKFQVIEIW